MLLSLQSNVVYGPVRSRRLGTSLGINILPRTLKACNFNCVYCQYGETTTAWRKLEGEIIWPTVEEVVRGVEAALRSLPESPAYITFSGNGEPTAHPSFGEIVDHVVRLRARYAPTSKIALLSNSSFLDRPSIRKSISKLDVRIMKLDCGDEAAFKKYNRPSTGTRVSDIVSWLKEQDDIVVQALFAGGDNGNFSSRNLDLWIESVREISPTHVQIYTLRSRFSNGELNILDRQALLGIRERLGKADIEAKVY